MEYYYETVYILNPDLPEEGAKKINTKVSEVVQRKGGKLLAQKDLGLKSLAYRISRQNRGRYFQVDYEGSGEVVSDLERNLRLTEECLRFLTVRQEPRQEGEKRS